MFYLISINRCFNSFTDKPLYVENTCKKCMHERVKSIINYLMVNVEFYQKSTYLKYEYDVTLSVTL